MSLIWIEYEGKEILLIDVANLRDNYAELTLNLASLAKMLKDKPLNSILAVADLRNTNLSNKAIMGLMKHAPLVAPYFRKSALVIEPNAARNIILDAVGQFVERVPKRFKNLEEAKTWLVSDEKYHDG